MDRPWLVAAAVALFISFILGAIAFESMNSQLDAKLDAIRAQRTADMRQFVLRNQSFSDGQIPALRSVATGTTASLTGDEGLTSIRTATTTMTSLPAPLPSGAGECGSAIFFVEVPLEQPAPVRYAGAAPAVAQDMSSYIQSARNAGAYWFRRPGPTATTTTATATRGLPGSVEMPDTTFTAVLDKVTGLNPLRNSGHRRAFRLVFSYAAEAGSPEAVAVLDRGAIGPIIARLRASVQEHFGILERDMERLVRIGSECTFRGLRGSGAFTNARRQWHLEALDTAGEVDLDHEDEAILALIDSGVSPNVGSTYQLPEERSFLSYYPGGDDGSTRHPHGAAMVKLVRSIAPELHIEPFRVMNTEGLGSTAPLARALDAAIRFARDESKPTVINMSLGWPREHTNLPHERRHLEYFDPLTGKYETTVVDGIGEVIRYLLHVAHQVDATSEPNIAVVAAAGNRPEDPTGRMYQDVVHTAVDSNLTEIGTFYELPDRYRGLFIADSGLPPGVRYDRRRNVLVGAPQVPGSFEARFRYIEPATSKEVTDLLRIVSQYRRDCSFGPTSSGRSWFYPAAYQSKRTCRSEDLVIPVGGVDDTYGRAVLTPHDVEPQVVAPGQWVFAERAGADPACDHAPAPVDLPNACFPKLVSGTSAASVLVSTAIALRQAQLVRNDAPTETQAQVMSSLLRFGRPVDRAGVPREHLPRVPSIQRMLTSTATPSDESPLRDPGLGGGVASGHRGDFREIPDPAQTPLLLKNGGPDRYALGILGPQPDIPNCPSCFALADGDMIEIHFVLEPQFEYNFGQNPVLPLPRVRVDGPGWTHYYEMVPPTQHWENNPTTPFTRPIPIHPDECESGCQFRLEAAVRMNGDPGSVWSWDIGVIESML